MPTKTHLRKDSTEMYHACVSSLTRFVSDTGFTEVVIGLSGGIDSSLVAVMAVDALGAEKVHGVLLPGPYSSADSVEDALELAENLRINTCTMPIGDAYSAFASGFEAAIGKPLAGLASENTQARCRMVYIMALSNSEGWMMLNTGNKSEAAMGYSTLYGDTAGAFAPIGGLYKTEVFALSKWRNAKAIEDGKVPPIPERVITKPPSAELSSNQTDEASMGIGYDDLDAILIAYVENGMDEAAIENLGFSKDDVEMVVRRYKSYAFKRAFEPPYAEI